MTAHTNTSKSLPGWPLRSAGVWLMAGALLVTGCGSTDPAAEDQANASAATETDASSTTTADSPTANQAASPSEAPDTQDLETVSVGITNSATDIAFCIAEERGYAAEQGIDIELLPFTSGSDMVSSLAAGDLQVGGGAISPGLLNAVARDLDIRVVADKGSVGEEFSTYSLLVRKELVDSGDFSDFSDLEGRKVAGYSEGSPTQATLAAFLEDGGLTLDDIDQTFLGGSEHLVALSNGAVDASITSEPVVSQAVSDGVAVSFPSHEVYPGQQGAGIMYSNAFAQTDAATGFMIAFLQAARDYTSVLQDGKLTGDGADEIVQIGANCLDLDPDVLSQITAAAVDLNGELNMESLMRDMEFFEAQGMFEGGASPSDIEKVVDPSFAEAAVAELGRAE